MPPVDALVEAMVAPLEAMAEALELLQEYNPSHDARGRFSNRQGAGASTVSDYTVRSAVGEWQDGKGYSAIQNASKPMLDGGPASSGPRGEQAEAIVARFEPQPEIYRGMALSENQLKGLQVGATLGSPLASWSSDENVAGFFAGSSSKLGRGYPVVLRVKNAEGFDINGQGFGSAAYKHEAEIISGGSFRVVSRKQKSPKRGKFTVDKGHSAAVGSYLELELEYVA